MSFGPPAQQPARNSGTTPSGCVGAPPQRRTRIKKKKETYSDGRLRCQQVALRDELATLLLLGTTGSIGLAQLLQKNDVGF